MSLDICEDLEKIGRQLNEPYLLLRWRIESEGDIDVMLPANNYDVVRRDLINLLSLRGWRCVQVVEYTFMTSILLTKFEDEVAQSEKLDLIRGVGWYGVGGQELTDKLLAYARSARDCVDPVRDVIMVLQKFTTSGQLSCKDIGRIRDIALVEKTLALLLPGKELPHSLRTLHSDRKLSLLEKFYLRFFTSGTDSKTLWWSQVLVAHLKFKTGLFRFFIGVVAISGIDGSGKSTLIEAALRLFASSGFPSPKVIHYLPNWLPVPHKFLFWRGSQSKDLYFKPYSQPNSAGKVSSSVRFLYYNLLFLILNLYLRFSTRTGCFYLLDRSYLDFYVDPTRAGIKVLGDDKVINRMALADAHFFLLDVNPELAIFRKNELKARKAEHLSKQYKKTFDNLRLTSLNANESAPNVLCELINHLHSANVARLAE